jgi:hypothetical protein
MITSELPPSALAQSHDAFETTGRSPWRNLIAECVEEQHPVLAGRIRVRWLDDYGEERSLWVPTLSHLTFRKGDRVLVVLPDNWTEPLATGVVDGFAVRPSRPAVPAATIALKKDEAVRVQDEKGQEILEITPSDSGPVVRLLHRDVNLELPGALRVKADSLDLTASAGPVNITASHDVVVKGELVRLN